MRIMKNLQNFLLDQDYYIDIFNNCLHVYYYESLISLSDKLIEGNDLIVSAMDNHEILVKGIINNVRFVR